MNLRTSFLVFVIASHSVSADSPSPPHCSDQAIESSELKRNVSNTSLEGFERLQAGMARASVIAIVGNPTYQCGSGIAYDVYVLGDGREIWIAYPSGTTGWASVKNADGTKGPVIFSGPVED